MKNRLLIFAMSLALLTHVSDACAEESRQSTAGSETAYDSSVPTPTFRSVSYGSHPRQVLDVWVAESEKPTPVAFVIHGGGWSGGEKERVHRFVNVNELLSAQISVVAINYRLMRHANAEEVVPPVKAPLRDAARALQYVRSRAKEWGLDAKRIGAAGGSAGACSSLWLAFHDDLADLSSEDPVSRQSTRLTCAAVIGAQTTLDPQQMKQWTPNSRYGGHAFGVRNFAQFLQQRESLLPWIREYSPYHLASTNDPPVYLYYSAKPGLGEPQKDPTHTSNFGVKLKERLDELEIECELVYPGREKGNAENPTAYLIARLKA